MTSPECQVLTTVLVLERVQGAADLRRTTDRHQFPKGKNAKSFHVTVVRISNVQNPKLLIFFYFFFFLQTGLFMNMNIQKAAHYKT